MFDRIMHRVSFVILGACAVVIVVVTYWLCWPYKIMDIREVKVMNSGVMAGENVEIYLDAMKYRPYPATILRMLINDHAFTYPTQYSDSPVGNTQWILRIKIPENTPSGTDYRIRTVYLYQVNPLRTIRVEWESPEFEVKGIIAYATKTH
jgi:hypothetical protein